jgi:hypothetical protein
MIALTRGMTSKHLSALGALLLLGGVLAAQIGGTACSSPQSIAGEGGILEGDGGDGGPCPPTPMCEPGNIEVCGNCGKSTCDPCGQWGTCTNQGVCKPGDEGSDGCYEGQDAICNASCEWVCP